VLPLEADACCSSSLRARACVHVSGCAAGFAQVRPIRKATARATGRHGFFASASASVSGGGGGGWPFGLRASARRAAERKAKRRRKIGGRHPLGAESGGSSGGDASDEEKGENDDDEEEGGEASGATAKTAGSMRSNLEAAALSRLLDGVEVL